eukprot:NODE_1596_length_800_cov_61.059435_g1547_i0.p2 GENE.NODE_1596_length_800_cov_61.059435_g1547_i0~~NODE_1596_length_800_cov_61.059435_g1547_i0.p2  ORF type:complete len:217 (+),score=50.39 NODE_1596_length_800_cov_61.059435_g1547_i0:73-723(+)
MKVSLVALVLCLAVVSGKFCFPRNWQAGVEIFDGNTLGNKTEAQFLDADVAFDYQNGDSKIYVSWNSVPGSGNITTILALEHLNETFAITSNGQGHPVRCQKVGTYENFWPQCAKHNWQQYFPAHLGGWGKKGGQPAHLWAVGDKKQYAQAYLYVHPRTSGHVPDFIRMNNDTDKSYTSMQFYNPNPVEHPGIFHPPSICMHAESTPDLKIRRFEF